MKTPIGTGACEVYRKVPAVDRDAALGVLLTGQPDAGPGVLERFAAFVAHQKLDVDALWAAYENGVPRVSALLVPSAGRAAMLFLTPISVDAAIPGETGPETVRKVLAELAGRVCAAQDPEAIQLVQALLEPHQALERQSLLQADFSELAELSYMSRRVEGAVAGVDAWPDPPLPVGYSVRPWTEAARPLFVAAIEASYEQTMDCPGLVGVRSMQDVVAGHMGAGRFDPDLWHVVLDATDHPVAALLLAEVPLVESMEMVYLGLSPSVRGQGIGRGLVRWAVSLSACRQAQALTLAVDKANEPALVLYRSMGFTVTAHKSAMIWSLKQPSGTNPHSP